MERLRTFCMPSVQPFLSFAPRQVLIICVQMVLLRATPREIKALFTVSSWWDHGLVDGFRRGWRRVLFISSGKRWVSKEVITMRGEVPAEPHEWRGLWWFLPKGIHVQHGRCFCILMVDWEGWVTTDAFQSSLDIHSIGEHGFEMESERLGPVRQ